MIKRILTILFFFSVAVSAIAQEQINPQVVDSLILEGVNTLRQKKNRLPLKIAVPLEKAAHYHTEWMTAKHKLSHLENKKDLKTPDKRVLKFGGNYTFVGENVAYLSYDAKKTEQEIAKEFVSIWQHSKEHYKNMINRAFTLTGIAVIYDSEKQRIYATQVFAKP